MSLAREKLRKGFFALVTLVCLLAAGCATPTQNPSAQDTVILVPGIGGDDSIYGNACDALHDAGDADCLRVYDWGLTWGLCFVSLWSQGLHHHWEQKLALQITQWRRDHPKGRIAIIGHSAGTGVVLGALGDLNDSVGDIGPIILLNPSLSPGFDMHPALKHANAIHVFYSEWDVVWSEDFPVLFGGYDDRHGDAAGKIGFDLTKLSPAESAKVIQHPWQHEWISLGNPGGHFDVIAPQFVAKVLKPLIDSAPAYTPQSLSGNDPPTPKP